MLCPTCFSLFHFFYLCFITLQHFEKFEDGLMHSSWATWYLVFPPRQTKACISVTSRLTGVKLDYCRCVSWHECLLRLVKRAMSSECFALWMTLLFLSHVRRWLSSVVGRLSAAMHGGRLWVSLVFKCSSGFQFWSTAHPSSWNQVSLCDWRFYSLRVLSNSFWPVASVVSWGGVCGHRVFEPVKSATLCIVVLYYHGVITTKYPWKYK